MLYQQTQCELCENTTCYSRGKRNINFNKHNICGSFIKETVCVFDDKYRFIRKNDFDEKKEYVLLDENNKNVLQIILNKQDILEHVDYITENNYFNILNDGYFNRMNFDEYFDKRLKDYLYDFMLNKNLIFGSDGHNFANMNFMTYLITDEKKYLEVEEKVIKKAKYPMMYPIITAGEPFKMFGVSSEKLEQAVIDSKDAKAIYYFTELNKKYVNVKKLQKALIQTRNSNYIFEFACNIDAELLDQNSIEFFVFTSNDVEYIYRFAFEINWFDKFKTWQYFVNVKNYGKLIELTHYFDTHFDGPCVAKTQKIILDTRDVDLITRFTYKFFPDIDLRCIIDVIIEINSPRKTYEFVMEMIDCDINIDDFINELESIIKKDKKIYDDYLDFME